MWISKKKLETILVEQSNQITQLEYVIHKVEDDLWKLKYPPEFCTGDRVKYNYGPSNRDVMKITGLGMERVGSTRLWKYILKLEKGDATSFSIFVDPAAVPNQMLNPLVKI